jgi:squalene-hopene/tetraprenyl-beta-curcumene cyclase
MNPLFFCSKFRVRLLSRAQACVYFWLACFLLGSANRAQAQEILSAASRSYKNELQHSIDRGLAWLQANQNSNGWWSVPDYPAVTALALMAFEGDPSGRHQGGKPKWIERGYRHVLNCVQPDGGIHRTNLATYNTSICMLALQFAQNPEYTPLVRNARSFLIGLQRDFGKKGELDTPFDGGIGYGSKYEHSDMGNTLQALEALHFTNQLEPEKAETTRLNYAAAIHFLQRCQNLPGHNPEKWASDDPQNKGGFVYYPGHSMAGAVTNEAGRVALRSYGSISYGGLLSLIYAELKRDDPRVQAVFEWLRNNYTLEENPGMGQQGLYYYFHTMAKALSIYGVDELELANGGKSIGERSSVNGC